MNSKSIPGTAMVCTDESEASPRSRRQQRLEEAVAAFETPLLRYAARLLNNAAMAQDVVQNVFIKLFRQWPAGMQADQRLKGWLFRVTHNEAVDMIRAEERHRRLHRRQAADPVFCDDGLHCDPPADERVALVLGRLGVLALPERQVLLLRLQEGLSYEEIADITGHSSGYVGCLLHHAVKKISASLKRKEGV